MVHGVAQRVPGGMAELVGVRPVIVPAQRTPRGRPQPLGVRGYAGGPGADLLENAEYLR